MLVSRHTRESGCPELINLNLDSRLRGNDKQQQHWLLLE